MERVELKVKKMGCGACVARVTKALGAVPGVTVVSVEPGRAVVQRNPSLASDDLITTALRDAGYEATREASHAT